MKLLCALFGLLALGAARRPVKSYTIDLDLAPEKRFTTVINDFNSSAWAFYNKFFANDKALSDVLDLLSIERGPEPEEMQAEIQGMVDASKLPLRWVQGIQMLYELQTLMVPIENITVPSPLPSWLPKGSEVLRKLPWRGPGCTGIIAACKDGTVYHARNLDFSPLPYMYELVYTGIFTKGGKELFRSQMVAGYQCMVTGMRMGPNGYTLERNTRYPSGKDGNEEMFHNLLKDPRPLNGWSLRKILETVGDYDTATTTIATTKFVSTEYTIMAGVKKGTIMAHDPDGVAHYQTLGQRNFEEREDYIIITNFDFFYHDIRAYFDPTGGEIGHPRRVVAQQVLNATTTGQLTPQVLFDAINAKGVFADTIFQAIMNVETSLWNVSQPDMKKA